MTIGFNKVPLLGRDAWRTRRVSVRAGPLEGGAGGTGVAA